MKKTPQKKEEKRTHRMVTLAPIQTSLPIVTGAPVLSLVVLRPSRLTGSVVVC